MDGSRGSCPEAATIQAFDQATDCFTKDCEGSCVLRAAVDRAAQVFADYLT